MTDHVFTRREQKYLLDKTQRQALIAAMETYMEPEKYHRSDIRNIYYDTPDRRLIRRSLEKPAYKEKLRLRSYGAAQGEDSVFLEMKKKYKGIVYKRRVGISQEAAKAYMANVDARLEAGQIGREIDYFKAFYQNLQPALYLSYDRLAWRSSDGDLRVTLDWNICYRAESMDLTAQPGGTPLLPEEQSLLEIKAVGAMPLWLSGLLSSQKIRQVSFSKYGTAYTQLLQKELSESRGNTDA